MKSLLIRLFMFSLLTLIFSVGQVTSTRADGTSTNGSVSESNFRAPFDATAFDCLTGETVVLSGTVHIQSHMVVDSAGHIHIELHQNFQGVSGQGVVTGNNYQAVGIANTSGTLDADGLPREFTVITDLQFIGQGQAGNFVLRTESHITMNANGDITAARFNTVVNCR